MLRNVCTRIWGPQTEPLHDHRARVTVNVYDMLEPNLLTNIGYALGVGIYHSGVEIAGREYCFGGHDYEHLTGVFAVEPKIGPPGVLFKQSIAMGYTDLSENSIQEVLHDISQEFRGTSYSLLTRNCNHFSEELCRRLTGKPTPGWINRAAKLGTMFPCVIPDEWIEPPEYESDVDISRPSSVGTMSHPASPALSESSRMPLRHPSSVGASRRQSQYSSQDARRSLISFEHNYHHPNHNYATATSVSDGDSIVILRPSSPRTDENYSVNDPIKEPDSTRPEVIRSATQLSIGASLQDLEH